MLKTNDADRELVGCHGGSSLLERGPRESARSLAVTALAVKLSRASSEPKVSCFPGELSKEKTAQRALRRAPMSRDTSLPRACWRSLSVGQRSRANIGFRCGDGRSRRPMPDTETRLGSAAHRSWIAMSSSGSLQPCLSWSVGRLVTFRQSGLPVAGVFDFILPIDVTHAVAHPTQGLARMCQILREGRDLPPDRARCRRIEPGVADRLEGNLHAGGTPREHARVCCRVSTYGSTRMAPHRGDPAGGGGACRVPCPPGRRPGVVGSRH